MQTWHFDTHENKVPFNCVFLPIKGLNHDAQLWLVQDGSKMEGFKVSYEAGKFRIGDLDHILPKLMPQKYQGAQDIASRHDCWFSSTDDHTPKFIKKDGLIFASGLNGRGFKFMPNYGLKVY
jgi:glycine/D-amino acid oxidase-like deaminating enzyme